MPRVTPAYRMARREEIAAAAVRCLERQGVRDTSIADIVKESGLSTGAIYSHFSNKAELARYIVGAHLGVRIDELEAAARRGIVLTPRDVLLSMLRIFSETGLSPALVVQFWGEAMVDASVREEMVHTIARLREGLEAALAPWAASRAAADADAQCRPASLAIIGLAQGYIVRAALIAVVDVDEYVDAVAAVLSS